MYPGVVKSGLSLTKVIGGVSKTLSVANQLIPLYVKAKPLINNAKSTFNVAKEILSTTNTNNHALPSKVNKTKEKRSVNTITHPTKNTNNPVFFL